ncbi:Two-component response regulator SSK1p [Yamadazyma tenuis]|nr:Two-component response regulator SSK1p [Yamadazyma tenuis]
MVNQNDIVDDLKTHIVNKFPNALGKHFDSAELVIKIDLHSRKQAVPGVSTTNANVPTPPHKKMNVWASGPEASKSSSSPVTSTFDKSTSFPMQSQKHQQSQQHQHNASFSLMTLEPDQNVWNLLDLYFPGGMNMSDAFIIETPDANEPYELYSSIDVPEPQRRPVHEMTTNYFSGSQTNLSNFYRGSTSPVNQHLYAPGHYSNHQIIQHTPQAKDQNTYRSVSPNSANSSQGYFHPKPQYLLGHNHIYHDRSVSPSNNQKASPLPSGVNLHRRSHSNPPQSPVSSNNLNSSHPNQKAHASGTNQAVLLLPKNFSLSNSASGVTDKKRLSLDENFVKKNRDSAISPINKNLTNLKSPGGILEEDTEPFPSMKPNLPKLDVTTVKNESSLESPNTPTDAILVADTENRLSLNSVTQLKKSGEEQLKNLGPGPNNLANNASSTKTSPPSNTTSSTSNGTHEKSAKVSRTSSGSKKNILGTSATETVLPSISVLVVEDNAINQAILGAFLRKHKIHYEIAKNGAEAITKWRKGGFHLVLMDIQLPVKSGIEATKEIRHLERINRIGVFAENEVNGSLYPNELTDSEKLDMDLFRSPVIIVALTASSNASSDRSNALRAGCNDYLTKPVNLVWLQNKITEWGCMQALIDFDGWRIKRSNFNGSSAKILAAQKSKTRKMAEVATNPSVDVTGKQEEVTISTVLPLEIIDKSIGKVVTVLLTTDKEFTGKLVGFDDFVNVVLEDVTETDSEGNTDGPVKIMLLNGGQIAMISSTED